MQEGENAMFNFFNEERLQGLTDPEYGVELWLDDNGATIESETVEKLKVIYQALDEGMLSDAKEIKNGKKDDVSLQVRFRKLPLRLLEPDPFAWRQPGTESARRLCHAQETFELVLDVYCSTNKVWRYPIPVAGPVAACASPDPY